MRAKIGHCVMKDNIAYLLCERLQSLILLHVLKSSKSEKHRFKPILRQTAKIYPVRINAPGFSYLGIMRIRKRFCVLLSSFRIP